MNDETPQNILSKRFARGEITSEEYQAALSTLGHSGPNSPSPNAPSAPNTSDVTRSGSTEKPREGCGTAIASVISAAVISAIVIVPVADKVYGFKLGGDGPAKLLFGSTFVLYFVMRSLICRWYGLRERD